MYEQTHTLDYHKGFMWEAINMAARALRSDETPVGCVFVHNGTIIARGMNNTNKSRNGTRHCELMALNSLFQTHPQSILRETDLYVTVEPCIMCASALRQYRIRKVYFGCKNDRFGGTGGVLNIHSDPANIAPYPVHGNILRWPCIMLQRCFYLQQNSKAPKPALKKGRKLKTEIAPFGQPTPAALEPKGKAKWTEDEAKQTEEIEGEAKQTEDEAKQTESEAAITNGEDKPSNCDIAELGVLIEMLNVGENGENGDMKTIRDMLKMLYLEEKDKRGDNGEDGG